MILKKISKLAVFPVLFLFTFSYGEDLSGKSVKESCDATAKILVKCMAAEDCDKEAETLRISLSKATVLSEIEKERFVSFCKVECRKGNAFRKQGVLQEAVNNEYVAIYSRCVEVLSIDAGK